MSKAKLKTHYTCQTCGFQTPKWQGKCPDCGGWNSFIEEAPPPASNKGNLFFALNSDEALALPQIQMDQIHRIDSGIGELDRVLGGGVVPGSLVLVGGDPGIGKSTLVLQMLDRLAKKGLKVLYATGEESREQVKL